MSRRKNPVLSYLYHKPTNQAYCRVNGRPIYLGRYGSPGSRREYERLLAELRTSPASVAAGPRPGVTVAEVLLAFGGTPSGTTATRRCGCRATSSSTATVPGRRPHHPVRLPAGGVAPDG